MLYRNIKLEDVLVILWTEKLLLVLFYIYVLIVYFYILYLFVNGDDYWR